MKRVKKILALLLAAVIIMTVPEMQMFANEMVEQLHTVENRLNYVYVEKPYVETPETQNIVISWGDGSEAIRNMCLVVENENGSREEWACDRQEENLYLFSKEFSNDSEKNTYKVTEILFSQNGEEQKFSLSEVDVDTQFGVNKAYDGIEELKPLDTGLEKNAQELETSVITIGDLKNVGRAGNLVVAIDPGHDIRHAGAIGAGLKEHDLTLKIANYAKAELEKYEGVKVYMTRTTAACPYPATGTSGECIEQRVKAAAAAGANVFISFHLNSGPAGANGAEIIIPNSSWKPQVAVDGKELAEKIIAELAAIGLNKRPTPIYSKDTTINERYPDGSVSDYFSVQIYSKESGIPGLIVEHAFLSSSNDINKYLNNETGLKKLGVADATGIAKNYGLQKKGVKPSVSSVTIGNKNDFAGKFSVKISGASPETSIKTVDVAVWSTANGQDDLVWYTAAKKGNGQYQVDVDIKNHKNAIGEYQAHVYITDTSGVRGNVLGQTSTVIRNASSKISVSEIGSMGDIFQPTAAITNQPAGIKMIRFAVWSEKNGQDDLIWYTARQTSEGVWQTNVPVKNHKTYGAYFVHTYLIMSDGYEIFLGADKFTVSEPTVKSVSVENYNENQGTFDVLIRGLKIPFGISRVEVPVWCADNQSDIRWYTAVRQSNGDYKVSVNRANHNYAAGVYKIHTYVIDGLGIRKAINALAFRMEEPKVSVTATDKEKTEKNISLQAKNVGMTNTISSVRFAVWSLEGGQNDLVWYQAGKDSAGNWNASVPVSRHKSTGAYAVHAYAVMKNGTQKFIGNTAFQITKPSASVTIQNKDINAGTFEVKIHGIQSPSGVTKIDIPVWCAKNQSDIRWYQAVKQADGTYKTVVHMANHKYNVGNYNVHTYITMGNGLSLAVNAGTVAMELPKAVITANDAAKTEKTISLRAANVGVAGSVNSVRFAVWSLKGDQDDIVWYTGQKDSAGIWNASAVVSRHRTAGEYAVHAYAVMSNGTQKYLGQTSFKITQPDVKAVLQNKDVNKGTFEVKIQGIQSPSGIERIEIPVWCADNQSDLKWYTPVRQADGSYKVVVKTENHKYASGQYKVHIYVTLGNGIKVALNAGMISMEFPRATVSAADKDGTGKNILLQAGNVGIEGKVKSVRFAVWSLAGGQDDLIWYNGVKNSSGIWSAVSVIRNHKTVGEYAVHVYATMGNGVQKFAGQTSFVVEKY